MPSTRSRKVRNCCGWALAGLAGLALPAAAQCPDATALPLQPGLLLTLPDVGVGCTTGLRFKIDVPERATSLRIATRGGFGNLDLLAQYGRLPTPGTPQYLAAGLTNDETMIIEDPPAGLWFLQIRPSSGFSGAKLLADFAVPETFLAPGLNPGRQADPGPGGPRFRYFRVQVPEGALALRIRTRGGTGDVDLYVRKSSVPTDATFDYVSKAAGNDEGVEIGSPLGGAWKVGLYRSAAYSDVEITVEIDTGGACTAGTENLCLLNGRFKVEVDWINQHDGGTTGPGTAVPETDQNGSFYFFSRDNPELMVKLLDGRGINGYFWVFWGGLTDLEYNIRVTDTETDVVKIFHHAPGVFVGGADTAAFSDTP